MTIQGWWLLQWAKLSEAVNVPHAAFERGRSRARKKRIVRHTFRAAQRWDREAGR